MASQLLGIKTRFTNDLGSPLVGGQVYTYFAGTSTNQDTYSNAALTVPNTNPVILDDTGSADIFLKGAYRIRVFDKSGRFIEEQDNVTQAASQGDATELNSKIDAQKLDTGIIATAKFGGVDRTQADKNSDFVSIKDFSTLAEVQAAAIENSIKIFIPTGEHTYDLTNADMTLFWGYGQLKDSVTGAIYKPKNGDFVTPEMFGIREKVDETIKLNAMFSYAAKNGLKVLFHKSAEYWFNNIRVVDDGLDVIWEAVGKAKVTLRCIRDTSISYPTPVYIAASSMSTSSVLNGVTEGSSTIVVDDASKFPVGSLLILRYTNLVEAENRGDSREGFVTLVKDSDLTTNKLTLETPVPFSASSYSTWTATVEEKVSERQLKFSGLDVPNENFRHLVYFGDKDVEGTPTLYITEWDNSTKIASFYPSSARAFSVLPDVKVGDTVTIQAELTVEAYIAPVTYSIIGNISIVGEEQYDKTDGSDTYTGIKLYHGSKVNIDGLGVKHFPQAAMILYYSTNCILKNMLLEGANSSYNNYDGQGYGIAINTCTGVLIDNCITTGCRKGIDIGGAHYSFNVVVRDCANYSTGRAYTGDYFYPEGGNHTFGFGSHATALNVDYNNCTSYNTRIGVSLHGKNERVINCNHFGRGVYAVLVGAAINSQIIGCTYDDNHSLAVPHTSKKRSLEGSFLTIFNEYNTNKTLPITIRDNYVKSTEAAFISLDRAEKVPIIVMSNNTVYCNTAGLEVPPSDFYVFSNSGQKELIQIQDLGGNSFIDVNDTYNRMRMFTSETLNTTGVVWDKNYNAKSYIRRLENNTATYISCMSAQGIKLSITPVRRSRSWGIKDAYIYNDSTTTTSFGAVGEDVLKRATVINDVLTGTTGEDSSLNVSYAPSEGRYGLYIENRLGSTELFLIEVVEMGT